MTGESAGTCALQKFRPTIEPTEKSGLSLHQVRQNRRGRTSLVAENLFLRKQLAFYKEREVKPDRLSDAARVALVFWSRWFDWRQAWTIVQPETLIRWHRRGFKLFWHWP